MRFSKLSFSFFMGLLMLVFSAVSAPQTGCAQDLSNARVVTVEAFAYSPQDPGMGLYTASGTRLRRGVIAVDPDYIPMGTQVYIPGYGYAVAEDIGWNIRGNTIDIAFDTHEEAIYFGRQIIEIYLLN